jgi:selenocysteine lyase/cysteine desulfurase
MSVASLPSTRTTAVESAAPDLSCSRRPVADAPRRNAFGALAAVSGAELVVPLLDGRSVRYANLDYAASAPALESVLADQQRTVPYYASVHRGAGYASAVSTALYEQSRRTVADFVGARADDLTIFTRNTTDALNLLAGAVPAGVGVVCLDIEHHANLLPWQQIGAAVVPAAATLEATLDALERALVDPAVGLLAITGASNVTGEVLPLRRLTELAHRHGARIAVDGAQLVPHRRVDVADLGIDYLAFSGHKLYAPFGAGALVGRSDWLDAARPHLAGGGAVRRVRVDHTDWADGVARHEGGTPNVLGAAALAAACRAIDEIGDDHLRRHEWRLRTRLLSRLAAIPQVRLLAIWPDCRDAVGVVGFTVDGYDSGLVAAYLSAEHGIGVRDGAFCAHPLADRLGIVGGALRASFGLGSSSEDVDRLLAGLRTLVEQGSGHRYQVVAGRYQPVDDPRPLPEWITVPDTTPNACQA